MRESFGRMAMNDEEIVALVAGGHTLGKAHGAKPADCIGPEPARRLSKSRVSAGRTSVAAAKAADAMTSGLEGAWTSTPTAWSILYLDNLFRFEWKQVKSPAGATQWIPTDETAAALVPDAFDPNKRHAPIMFTTDLALKDGPGVPRDLRAFSEEPQGIRSWLLPRPGSS